MPTESGGMQTMWRPWRVIPFFGLITICLNNICHLMLLTWCNAGYVKKNDLKMSYQTIPKKKNWKFPWRCCLTYIRRSFFVPTNIKKKRFQVFSANSLYIAVYQIYDLFFFFCNFVCLGYKKSVCFVLHKHQVHPRVLSLEFILGAKLYLFINLQFHKVRVHTKQKGFFENIYLNRFFFYLPALHRNFISARRLQTPGTTTKLEQDSQYGSEPLSFHFLLKVEFSSLLVTPSIRWFS